MPDRDPIFLQQDETAPERPTRARHMLSLWLALAATTAYLCRSCISVVEETMRQDLGLSEKQMGFILGPAFFWSYALAQIPGGALGERFGSRWILPIFSAVWSLGTACWSFAKGFAVLLIGRIGVGVAQAGLFPCSAVAVSRWYPLTERAFTSGILGAAMQFGALLAAFGTAALLSVTDWQTIFVLFAIPGLLWSAGFYWWFRDDPEQHPDVNPAERDLIAAGRDSNSNPSKADAPSVDWMRLVASPEMWMICLQQFFRAAAAVWFASWFPTYLQKTRGVSTIDSGWLTAIPLLASLLGSLIAGSVSDAVLRRTGNRALARKGLAAASLLVCAGLVFSAYFIDQPAFAAAVIGLGAFFAAFAGPCAYASAIDMGGKHITPVFATMNMIGNFGAGLLPWLVPYFRALVDSSEPLLNLFGGNSWNAVLILFVAMYVLAAGFWMLLRTDRPVFAPSPQESPA